MKFTRYHSLLFSTIVGAILLGYILTKASVSSFTHDESFTYLTYAPDSFLEIISFSDWYTNNHILNSLFIKYAEKLFGNSELALRLPNLILLLVYMVYAFLLFRGKNSFLGFNLFILLCTNVLLMDLFGLARGYGMSCGFMLMSLYHFMAYFKEHKRPDAYLFHFASLLGILSNFTLVTFYVAMLLVYNLQQLLDTRFVRGQKFRFFQTNRVHIIPFLLVSVVLYEPLRRLIIYSDLNFGGKEGFYADTVSHLIMNTFHNIALPSSLTLVFQIVFTLIILIPFFLILYHTLRKNIDFFDQNRELVTSNLLWILISIIIIAQHQILKSDYPIGRFSIFLFPLFMVHLGYLMNYFLASAYQKVSLILLSCLTLISALHFGITADLYTSAEWGYDSHTKNMIQTLTSYREKNPNQSPKIKLGNHWLFEPTLNYYRKRHEIDWLLPANRAGISKSDDYLYIFDNQFPELKASDYEIIKEYKDPGTLLIKRITATDKN